MISTWRLLGVLILLTVLVQACSTPVSMVWRDFNAYFNTYYNAKTSFERGLDLQKRQQPEINPERLLRIHPPPTTAGRNDFAYALQKSADVIRFHPRSRWADNALELIGLSYFYTQEYFAADQKFQELLLATPNPVLQQRAILWRGRAALELENYSDGISFLESRLFASDVDWSTPIASEIFLVKAQLYVARRQYDEAETALAQGLPGIDDRALEMRARFLHGQVLERLGRYDEAFEAYARASHRSNPNYDLIYHAERKMGIVARKDGDPYWAYDHFLDMRRDDRHFSYLSDIEYEIGRTLQYMEYFVEAAIQYEDLLYFRSDATDRETRARIYYGLGEIYRDFYADFSMAAAYFDSSATQAGTSTRMPEAFDARELARSFGEYARISSEMNHLDSLLWLSELPQSDFDEVIERIRQQKVAELEREEREQRRLNVVDMQDVSGAGAMAEEETDNGFLNHRNAALIRQNSQAFQAWWGQRPLVDDWRRMDQVRVNVLRQMEEEGQPVEDVEQVLEQVADPSAAQIEIDVSEIPFEEEDRTAMRVRIAGLEYELGNVFYEALAMPDSAMYYFSRVVNRFPDLEIAPQAMYSLSELHESSGNHTQALQYAQRLVQEYPHTIFAQRIASQFDLMLPDDAASVSQADSLAQVFAGWRHKSESVYRAGELRRLAAEHYESEIAPMALFLAARDYMALATHNDHFNSMLLKRHLVQTVWQQERDQMHLVAQSAQSMLQDSLFVEQVVRYGVEPDTLEQPADSLQTETEAPVTLEDHLRAISEKQLPEPDLSALFPYEGALWDSARVALHALVNEYPDFTHRERVLALAEELELERVLPLLVDTNRRHTCEELDDKPEIIGGTAAFLNQQSVRDHPVMDAVLASDIPGTIRFSVDIDRHGQPESITADDHTQQANQADSEENEIQTERAPTEERSSEQSVTNEISQSSSSNTEISAQESALHDFLRWAQTQLSFTVPKVHGVAVPAHCEFTLDLTEAHKEQAESEQEPSL